MVKSRKSKPGGTGAGSKHKCPFCDKTFTTRAALKQHENAVHEPVRSAKPRSGKRKNQGSRRKAGLPSSVYNGSDILSRYAVNSSTEVGTIIGEFKINPRSFDGTRLSSVAGLYNRWRPTKLTFRFRPLGSTVTAGGFLVAYIPDSAEVLPYEMTALTRRLYAAKHAECQAYTTASVTVTDVAAQKWLYTEQLNEIDSFAGKFVVVLNGSISGATGTITCLFELDWDIVFDGPDVTTSCTTNSPVAFLDERYVPTYSSYSSSCFSGKATILRYSNANFSLFQGLPGRVYKLLTPTSIKYCKKDESSTTASGILAFFVPWSYYGYWYALGFETFAQADKYIKSPKVENVLTCYASGPSTSGPIVFQAIVEPTSSISQQPGPPVDDVGHDLHHNLDHHEPIYETLRYVVHDEELASEVESEFEEVVGMIKASNDAVLAQGEKMIALLDSIRFALLAKPRVFRHSDHKVNDTDETTAADILESQVHMPGGALSGFSVPQQATLALDDANYPENDSEYNTFDWLQFFVRTLLAPISASTNNGDKPHWSNYSSFSNCDPPPNDMFNSGMSMFPLLYQFLPMFVPQIHQNIGVFGETTDGYRTIHDGLLLFENNDSTKVDSLPMPAIFQYLVSWLISPSTNGETGVQPKQRIPAGKCVLDVWVASLLK